MIERSRETSEYNKNKQSFHVNDCITARRATLRDCNSNNHISADGKLKAA